MSAVTVEVAGNFRRNLDVLEAFLEESERAGAFAALLDRLFDDIVPMLQRFPDAGRDFSRARPGAAEAGMLHQRLEDRLGARREVRQLVVDEHLVLYLREPERVVLLAIKHHRQLSYDLAEAWLND